MNHQNQATPQNQAAPGVVTHAEGQDSKTFSGSPTIIAQAVLDASYPPGTLRHWNGDFYQWREHPTWEGYFSKIPRRALAPFIYQQAQAQGVTPTTGLIREVTLSLSALVLVMERPRPDFGEAHSNYWRARL